MFRGFMKLTDHVTTVDTRAISDFSAQRVNDVMAEISKFITKGIQSFSTNSTYTYLHIESLESF